MMTITPRFPRRRTLAALFLALCAALPAPTRAQDLGTLTGTVTDAEGTPLSSAVVEIESELERNFRRGTTTDLAGRYRIVALPPGPYRVSVRRAGYRGAGGRVLVALNEVMTQNFVLQVRPVVIDTVTVSFPPGDRPLGSAQRGTLKLSPMSDHKVPKVRVRLEVEALCRIGIANLIACALPLYIVDRRHGYVNPLQPTVVMMTEAVFPYQGASYE